MIAIPKKTNMNTLTHTTDTALAEGFIGCIVAATYLEGLPTPEDYDNMVSSIAGRDIFSQTDIFPAIKSQMTLRYVLEEEEFLIGSCQKITSEWKLTVFAICYDLIMEKQYPKQAPEFLKNLQRHLHIEDKDAQRIRSVIDHLHKGRI